MAEEGQDQDLSEEATSFKLESARRKGMVARGTDLGFFSTLVAVAIAAELMGQQLVERLALAMRRGFLLVAPMAGDVHQVSASAAIEAVGVAGKLALPALILTVVAITIEIVQLRGLIFSAQPLKPDFSRLNPAKGLKRLFSMRLMKELLKNIVKFAVYGTAVFLLVRHLAGELAHRASNGRDLADILAQAAGQLLLLFVFLAAALALLDQLIARREFSKQMRMSHRDITREHREREGEPRQKQKRKQILAEILKQASAAADVKGADVLITNPTHYAVALRYRTEDGDAPIIRAQGRNAYAQRMRETARREGIAIVRNPRLARALYLHGTVGQPIGSAQFVAVADIYIMLRRALQRREKQP